MKFEKPPKKGIVLIFLTAYNATMETLHLLKSKANVDRLLESIQQMKSGQTVTRNLLNE